MIRESLVVALNDATVLAAFDPNATVKRLQLLGIGVFALVVVVAAIGAALMARNGHLKKVLEIALGIVVAALILGIAGLAGLQATGVSIWEWLL